MENTIEIQLGQELFKYATVNLMRYKVFGILDREDGKYYQIRCLTCSHGRLCEVLIKLDDCKNLKYVSMLNDEEEDLRYYWHTTDDGDFYCLTKKQSLEKYYERAMKKVKKEIYEHQEEIKRKEQKLIKYKEILKGLE